MFTETFEWASWDVYAPFGDYPSVQANDLYPAFAIYCIELFMNAMEQHGECWLVPPDASPPPGEPAVCLRISGQHSSQHAQLAGGRL